MDLVVPSMEHLPSCVAALESGWSPDNVRGAAAAREALADIASDAPAYVARMVDREALGPPLRMLDGSMVKRLPGYILWMWDGEFCGSIGLRWQPGTSELPPNVPGHIGYAVVPWKRGKGYATLALKKMLEHARAEGLAWVQLTSRAENASSHKVITANGGVVVERFTDSAAMGGGESLRFRIDLRAPSA